MDELRAFIDGVVREGAYRAVLSGPRKPGLRRVTFDRAEDGYFIEKLTEKQAFHERVPLECAAERMEALFADFSQINAWNSEYEFTARLTKKGKLLSGRRRRTDAPAAREPERKKKYLIEAGRAIPPLADMGVMTPDGKIKANMNDKFRQIERFLEFIDELLPEDDGSEISVVDFGCGKSYLTFIVYYYFTEIKRRPVRMTGVDLKADVIEYCRDLAEKYGYTGLRFLAGDIADFVKSDPAPIDLIITLHACDTATDLALFNAVRFGAKHILSVPCCQHELNKSADMACLPLFDDGGILRERACALLTDSIRQKLLTASGYSARVIEFVDLAHTPKNLMIRAKRAALPLPVREKAQAEAEEALSLMKTEQTLHRLLAEAGLLPKQK